MGMATGFKAEFFAKDRNLIWLEKRTKTWTMHFMLPDIVVLGLVY